MTGAAASDIAPCRQNRVTPFGTIVAVPARGAWMGNRGILHDTDGRIVRSHTTRGWVICSLCWTRRSTGEPVRQTIMAPGRYTQLFFLDEATALAAGHRPCAECRRPAYKAYVAAAAAGGVDLPMGRAAPALDRLLHAQRPAGRGKPRVSAPLATLPEGTMVALAGHADDAWLLWSGSLQRWTPDGYRDRLEPFDGVVEVLTPQLSVVAMAAGYRPQVHPVAEGRAAS